MLRSTVASIVLVSLLVPSFAIAAQPKTVSPHPQDFVVTAYYSPLPNQCCYITGSYLADVELNGNGTNGADGTEVKEGMIAAPKQYAFGTKIQLDGIGVGTVHDRGGAIKVTDKGVHRLDLWVGTGEAGLARALAFGVRHISGTVFPVGSKQPADSLPLAELDASSTILRPFIAQNLDFLSLHPTVGSLSAAVGLLQEKLNAIGYLNHGVTNRFGPDTLAALTAFEADYSLMDEGANQLTTKTAAYIQAAEERMTAIPPIDGIVDGFSPPKDILNAKRTLRFLGYYQGRTTGVYDDALRTAIIKFQKDQQIIASSSTIGAGRIGPQTSKRLLRLWDRSIVVFHAEKLLALHQIDQVIADRNLQLQRFLGTGDKNTQVSLLQQLLASRGLFDVTRISGFFGAATKQAVIAYQLAQGLIKSTSDRAAGYVGPGTMAKLHEDERQRLFRLVQAEGWQAL